MKRRYVIINIIIFFIEIIITYLLVNRYLSNDYISPSNVSFYEHLINKINDLV